MLEALISSRIRRTLFEYLLTHPTNRFYLRGLAKHLRLSISPLRRELARLEQSGMLRAEQEGNIRFYTVTTASPAFLELQQVSQPVHATAPAAARSSGSDPSRGVRPLNGPVLVGTALVGIALMLVMAGLFYMTMTNGRFMASVQRALTARSAASQAASAASPGAAQAGAMRGARWQVVPGGFGGFSTSSTRESF